MTVLLAASLILAGLQASPQPAVRPCTAPEYRQFDFWIGDWVVRDPKGQQVGTNRIEAIEGGCGLQEHWTSAGGRMTGRSLNAYRPATGRWHQTWIGSDGAVLLLDGSHGDGRMVLEGRSKSRDGADVENRITWSRLDGGRVRQLWEQSADGGTTWTTVFDGIYSRP